MGLYQLDFNCMIDDLAVCYCDTHQTLSHVSHDAWMIKVNICARVSKSTGQLSYLHTQVAVFIFYSTSVGNVVLGTMLDAA
jgi:hypothetical protein